MRLINATTLQLEDFPSAYHVPAYAVLSHTWEDDEVLFHEMVTAPSAAKRRKGYGKILKAAQLARARGLSHVWVDTCCIDKSSSAELTEAINSMYRWYECAGACIAYLSDLAPGNDLDLPEGLDKCRWFTRGWTLQELIAPRHVDFYDAAWSFRGSKANLSDCITRITGIEKDVLDHTTPLANLSVAKRMSWAAKRQTTRIEDIAYCLLGIFDVNMPMLYGEGEKAFIRLQEKIIQSSCDLSIFAWTYHPPDNTRARLSPGPAYRSLYKWPSPFRAIQGLLDVSKLQETVSSCEAHLVDSPTEIPNYKPAPRQYHGEYHGILADLPWHFQNCGDIRLVRGTESIPGHFSLTNRGLRIGWPLDLSPVSSTSFAYRYVMSLGCSNGSSPTLGVFLRKCGSDLYVRMNPEKLAFLPYEEPDNEICQARDFYIMASVPKHRCFIANHAHEDTTDVSRGQSNNIVLRNRAVGLQVLAPGGTSDNWLALPHPGGLRKLEAYPPGLWDEHDMAFFEASELPRSWCVYYFDGDVRIKEGIAQLKYIFALVGWAARGDGAVSPQYTLVSPDEVSPTRLAVFLSSLTTASPESSSWFLETFTRMFGRPMAPRSVPATIITDDGITLPARVRPVVDTALKSNICRNNIWRVRFEISMASSMSEGIKTSKSPKAVGGVSDRSGAISQIVLSSQVASSATKNKLLPSPSSRRSFSSFSTSRPPCLLPETQRFRSTFPGADSATILMRRLLPVSLAARRIRPRKTLSARTCSYVRTLPR